MRPFVKRFTLCCQTVVCWPDCKPEGPLFSAEVVCISVCLSVCLYDCVSVCLRPALLPFNVDRFWWNLVTRTLLWSSLAATIMDQIGRRGTARVATPFWKFKKSKKITEFEFQNSGPSFFASVSPVYCKQEGQHPLTGQRAPPISGGT